MEKQIENEGLDGMTFPAPPVYQGAKGEVVCHVGSYGMNGTLRIELVQIVDMPLAPPGMRPFQEPFGTVTVNLPVSHALPTDVQFIDVNNLKGIGEWLVSNGIARPTGYECQSGYVTFPAYRFNLSEKERALVDSRRAERGVSERQLAASMSKKR